MHIEIDEPQSEDRVDIWQADQFDIAKANSKSLNDTTTKNILTSTLLPKEPFQFPATETKTQKRCFQKKWITDGDFVWLAYSKSEDSVFCKPCWLFFHEGVGKSAHRNPGQFVTGYRKWKNAKEDFNKHKDNIYHLECVQKATSFIKVLSGTQQDIRSRLDIQRAKEVEENRKALKPIIKTILFCAEQELPLRGDHDSGALSLTRPAQKDGKFRALLRFRLDAGDENLRAHIANSANKAKYLSPDIQNEILETGANIVTKKIISKVNSAKCFSILGDETMDVSGTEQLSLCLRYVDFSSEYPVLREDFVGFIPITYQTSENLTEVILKTCKSFNLDMENLVGQGYDGAANISGHSNGVQARIRQQYPKARYVHCASHRLNLALSNSMPLPSIRNCLGLVNEIANLFRNHLNASTTFKDVIQKHAPDTKKRRLVRLCETRFIKRHESIISFVELFKFIVLRLEIISSKTWAISSKASAFLAAVEKSDFLLSLFVCEQLFSLTLPLSVQLQEKSMDFVSAINRAKELIRTLRQIRETADSFFTDIFQKASQMSKDIFETDIAVPRVISRQTTRANPPYTTPESYFRVTIFISCVDALIQNTTKRLLVNEDILSSFQILLPGFASIDKADELKNLTIYFEEQISMTALISEYRLWCASLSQIDPSIEVLKLLQHCDHILKRLTTS